MTRAEQRIGVLTISMPSVEKTSLLHASCNQPKVRALHLRDGVLRLRPGPHDSLETLLPLNDEHVVVALAAVFPQAEAPEEGGAAKTPSRVQEHFVLSSFGLHYALHRYEHRRIRLRGQILDMAESQRGLKPRGQFRPEPSHDVHLSVTHVHDEARTLLPLGRAEHAVRRSPQHHVERGDARGHCTDRCGTLAKVAYQRDILREGARR